MTTSEILRNIMPCGCVCYTCSACGDGAISFHSKELLRYLDGMEGFRENHPDYEIIVNTMRTLRFWATQECPGCRVGGLNLCTYENCPVCGCSKQHNVDFCYMCAEYPCEKINSVDKWREANDYMLEHGADAHFEREKRLSHYRNYKKPDDAEN